MNKENSSPFKTGTPHCRKRTGSVLKWIFGGAIALLLAPSFGGSSPATSEERVPLTGLWSGTAQIVDITAIGEDNLKPAAGVFELPVIIHVDGTGSARLLKEVVIVPGDDGMRLLVNPSGRRGMIEQLPERTLRKSRRLATAAYDFKGSTLPLTGNFAPGQDITGQIVVETDLPTNPFAHLFHPDHDNLIDNDPQGRSHDSDVEVYRVSRRLRFTLPGEIQDDPANDPDAEALRDEYHARIIGIYRETLDGLAAKPISTQGRLFLRRIAMTARIEE
jgi:hypothetical protein